LVEANMTKLLHADLSDFTYDARNRLLMYEKDRQLMEAWAQYANVPIIVKGDTVSVRFESTGEYSRLGETNRYSWVLKPSNKFTDAKHADLRLCIVNLSS
jgi:hypothetical protein